MSSLSVDRFIMFFRKYHFSIICFCFLYNEDNTKYIIKYTL